ncbi:TetR/AcrR family transcriptional regulator [Mycolicibacterium fluoranthenivorans]|uniref:AcrR family transcriptional regulator n=1 Tax=Mycolicibacterium fluoranthenivorans TaxID=258505 RepID=A0A7X5TWE8_9MYCO|nr:TetR family transcriptional regulator [Mycolicibacterium fluoranthenivorans]MCV7356613.1 TetR family transcriptional regulator [Mycolicibacterium fluoranthenivorans]NIH94005.1 AcrR family transcriptional regulator [Mycolicibacterium fluoranthenivorans]
MSRWGVAERRTDALSKERIVEAAIEILDTDGEGALTFRALAARLATGSGAIYHHVPDKNTLLAAATDSIVTRAMAGVAGDLAPADAIRAIAVGLFDTIDEHPWVGAQLHRHPRSALLRIFEGIGGRIRALGVPEAAQFNSASALTNYILGVAAQNAENARSQGAGADRTAFLADVVRQWTRNDPARYPFVHSVAAQLRDHDDREQFLAGIDLILAGMDTLS